MGDAGCPSRQEDAATEEIESDASVDLRVILLARVLTLSVRSLWSGNVRLVGSPDRTREDAGPKAAPAPVKR
ncbi:hypothetical protein IQ62_05310 [Streptomyces scabiei]|nr:hypothetical protein IQ62_05310 [Streptomyces scabiei]